MKKPSERIVEIQDILWASPKFNSKPESCALAAICQFLDEQAAKQDLSSEHIKEE